MAGKFVSLIEDSGVIKKHRSGTFIPSGDIDFYDEEHIEALIEEYKQIVVNNVEQFKKQASVPPTNTENQESLEALGDDW